MIALIESAAAYVGEVGDVNALPIKMINRMQTVFIGYLQMYFSGSVTCISLIECTATGYVSEE